MIPIIDNTIMEKTINDMMIKKKNLEHKAIAIIGDGAMTAGMAFEGLNNAGDSSNNILVILNDNDMSISKNVGALNNYLANIFTDFFVLQNKIK